MSARLNLQTAIVTVAPTLRVELSQGLEIVVP
jgi:hypothetical protein